MDLLKPDGAVKVSEKQAMQKQHHDSPFKGPLSYIIQLKSGLLWRRHVNQLQDGIQKDNPIGRSVCAHTSPDDTAYIPPDDIIHTPSDTRTHVPLDDTVDVTTPNGHTSEPVVASQPVSNATENFNPPNTAATCQ